MRQLNVLGHGSMNDFSLDIIGRERGATGRRQTGRAQDHGHDAQTAGRKIQRMRANRLDVRARDRQDHGASMAWGVARRFSTKED